jgi:hypothetical protein
MTHATTLRVSPDYRHANPFQDLLYAQLDSVEVWRPGEPGGVLHLQWEDCFFRDAADEAEAADKVGVLMRLLDQHRAAGGKLIWTLHNLTAHNCPHKQAEQLCRRGLVQRADAIHIMADRHRAALPEGGSTKATVIAHPSYAQHYPKTAKPAARAKLGLGDKPLFFHFGAARSNRAYSVLQDPTVNNPAVDKILSIPGSAQTVNQAGIRLLDRRLSDAELGLIGSAADFSIFADSGMLNSGTLGFYLDFGMMVFLERAAIEWMDLPGYPEELIFDSALDTQRMNTLLADVGLRRRMEIFLQARAERVCPERVSSRFAQLVRSVR